MNKRKTLLVAMALSMVAILAAGATLAYFTAEDEVKNVFTMGNVDISLDEAPVVKTDDKWTADEEAARVKTNEYKDIYPGAVLPKDPTVHNDGSYEAYVRAKVVVDFNKLAGLQADKQLFNGETADAELLSIVDIDTANWTFETYAVDFESRTVTYTYTLNEALAADTDAKLFSKVTIPTALTNEEVEAYGLQNFTIDVLAEAIQTFGFENAEAAWTAYDAE